jgi:SNF2 family DNA or RNA helicase
MSARPRDPSPSLLEQVVPKLRPFQREALEFATEGKLYDRQHAGTSTGTKDNSTKLLLADEMGLGKVRKLQHGILQRFYSFIRSLTPPVFIKTVTSLAIMAYYEPEWPLLILCPASLRYTWPAEIEKFFPSIPPQTIYVASGFSDIGFTKQKDVRIVVVTYSLLQNRSAVAKVLEDQNFNCIIADESHNLKSKTSQRTKMILPILSRARRLVLLSGTPALARPVELWTQLS